MQRALEVAARHQVMLALEIMDTTFLNSITKYLALKKQLPSPWFCVYPDLVTDDDLVVMASESGVLPIPEKKIVKKWRLQPGKMFLIDMEQGRIIDDLEAAVIEAGLAAVTPALKSLLGQILRGL